jgi:5-(carboxyamino)imidazole ribonucleotide synthase
LKIQDYLETVGLGGAGQLGLMMIYESRGLPLKFNVYSEKTGDPALKLADRAFIGDQFEEFVDESDVVTFEFEHINDQMLKYADQKGKLRPSYKSVELKKERYKEKEFLRERGYPVGNFMVASNGEDALSKSMNFKKFVIKSSKGGYDGKGQFYYNKMINFPAKSDEKFVVEEFVDYKYEASIISARDKDGNVFSYDPSFNTNQDGILISNRCPFNNKELNDEMKEISYKLLKDLNYQGVMGIEFFITKEGLLINEFAPRVHNTGHHTLMGSSYSQFEMHVRAVAGLPLFAPKTYVPSGIVNIIGLKLSQDQVRRILLAGNTRIYDYRKNDLKRKRKMGHVCVTATTSTELKEKLKYVESCVYGTDLKSFL